MPNASIVQRATLEQAIAIIHDCIQTKIRLAPQSCRLDEVATKYLAEPIIARYNNPRQAVAVMDGYAVAAKNLHVGDQLTVIAETKAGDRSCAIPLDQLDQLDQHQAIRVYTGAALPDAVTRVIMQEEVQRVSNNQVRIAKSISPDRYIRPLGNDFKTGQQLVGAGNRISARIVMLAAANDYTRLQVFRPLSVALLASGNELRRTACGSTDAKFINFADTTIPASSLPALAALIKQFGMEVVAESCQPDDEASITEVLQQLLQQADLLITIGGISVGKYDLILSCLQRLAAKILFRRLDLRPGQPTTFAVCNNKPILALPGNPVSTMVAAQLLLPAVTASCYGAGQSWQSALPEYFRGVLSSDLKQNGNRENFLRAQQRACRNSLPKVDIFPSQDSGQQLILAQANCLVRRLPHAPALARGSEVDFLPLN